MDFLVNYQNSNSFSNTNGIIFGNDEYARGVIHSLSNEELTKYVRKANDLGIEAYVLVNKIFHNEELPKLREYLSFLSTLKIDGIIFGDLAVYTNCVVNNLVDLLIYNPDITVTSYEDFNFWSNKGIKGVFISPFISKEELLEILSKKKLKAYYLGYGYINMFYSKRPLLENYFKYFNMENIYKDKVLYLKEETRDEYAPIVEDKYGVNVYTPYIYSAINIVKDLVNLDYLVLDSLFIGSNPIEEFKFALTSDYIDPKAKEGFLAKKTVYKKDGDLCE